MKHSDPNPMPDRQLPSLPLSGEDLAMLDSLVKSPAFAALKRALAIYRDEARNVLDTATDTANIFRCQGRLAGLKVIENLPGLLVEQWTQKQKKIAEYAKEDEERAKRLKSQDPRAPIR